VRFKPLERPHLQLFLTEQGVGSAVVSKILVSKQDLERIALQALRSFPGGEAVTAVEVEYRPRWRQPRTYLRRN
jgi:hypothetical protein